jgi:non-canonical purine NTP pyrophosphatase (RdgB/HAM1 family)
MIYFITSSKGKIREAKAILGRDIDQYEIDLPEIQETDPRKIIAEKIKEGLKHKNTELIVEDTSLCLDALGCLPGPLIKWFIETIGNDGLYEMVEKLGNCKAQARVMLGYAKDAGNIKFFDGMIEGRIVLPRGQMGFGWDPIFMPDGHEKTFAQMDEEEKNAVSMRIIALEKLKNYLDGR